MAAFSELIDALVQVRDDYLLDEARAADQLEVLDGLRFVLHLMSEASELWVEGDPERPFFASMVTPTRKFLGDNPDAIYHQALVRGDRAYRIRGRRNDEVYVSFTVHGPDPAGGINGPVLGDINDRQFEVADDGTFELVLSADEQPGDWLPLDPAAQMVIVRSYFSQSPSVQCDRNAGIELAIEPLVDPGPAPVLDDETLSRRLHDASRFITATTLGTRVFGPSGVPFAADEINEVGTPWSFRAAGVDAAGAVDIYYSSGRWELGPDDALVMEGTVPPCDFVNVMLWNVHAQTLDYVSRRSSLNGEEIVLRPDGSYRIVVAQRDPGTENWLDTGGHRRGTIFWRFLLPTGDPQRARCRVVPVEDVAALPA